MWEAEQTGPKLRFVPVLLLLICSYKGNGRGKSSYNKGKVHFSCPVYMKNLLVWLWTNNQAINLTHLYKAKKRFRQQRERSAHYAVLVMLHLLLGHRHVNVWSNTFQGCILILAFCCSHFWMIMDGSVYKSILSPLLSLSYTLRAGLNYLAQLGWFWLLNKQMRHDMEKHIPYYMNLKLL